MVITYPVKSGLYVNLTNRCPCACVFCLRQNAPGIFGSDSLWLDREPTVDEVIASIESRNLDDFTELVFCGYGEPTERLDDLLAVARHVKSVRPGMLVRVNTNGLSDLIHGEPTAAKLKGLVDTVSISLNTPDPEEYLKMCRPKFGLESWQAMLDFAKSCREYVPNVVMTIVDAPVTTPEIQEKCKAITDSLGVRLRIRPYEG
ncbi:MAG: TIGR04100 family radical SAM protein [Kiritimatiellae bacterium]|nr:TIGR04100 family radical SAM protein [Kiritimatiellia bacterium]MBR3923675.1 TIGR04100 family radical SAM protein [Kiritimatiellia bacterium]